MKKLLLVCLMIFFTSCVASQSETEWHNVQEQLDGSFLITDDVADTSMQDILVNVAQIVNHFFNIALDPENPEQVAPAIGGIIQSVINIALLASKDKGEQLKKLAPVITHMILRKIKERHVNLT